MGTIRYVQKRDCTRRLICRTLHEHNGMVMHILNEDGSKKRNIPKEWKESKVKLLHKGERRDELKN